MAYIKVNNVSKTIKKYTVLKSIDFELESGKIYGFVGRNGSGKTMLFRVLSGLVRPSEGEVTIDGKQLGKDISFPEDLGLLIENIGLWEWLSGTENLQMLTKTGKKLSLPEIKNAIARVGLDPKDRRPTRKYSLGMKQRIVLAQALMEKPRLLILDEPTNALDENGVAEIRDILLEEKKRGATILLASHNKEDIQFLCDKIFWMSDGKITDVTLKEETADEK